MKRTISTLSCALLLAGAARAQANDFPLLNPPSSSTYTSSGADTVGDDAAFVGDMDDRHAVQTSGSYVGDTDFGASPVESPAMPVAMQSPHHHTHATGRSHGARYNASSYCDTGFGQVGGVLNACNDHWLRAETLLWFTEQRDTPPLVTTGAALENQFGDPIESGLAPGYRLDYGKYFAGGKYGIGARVWGLYGESEDYSIATDDPTFNIQRPFYNTALDAEDALIVSGTFGPNQFDGSFNAESELDIIATEAYGRLLFGQASNFRVDLIGGYSYFGIDDDLRMTSSSRTVAGGNIGQVRTFTDHFETENRFHGGQLGFETVLNKGRWSMTSLTKVHLGNMNQRVQISGQAVDQIVGLPPTVADKGFFAQDQQGVHERDEFTFVPEINIKLGYAVRNNVELTVGYSFLYWSSLAFAGDQLDRNINGTDLVDFTMVPAPAPYDIEEDGFWIQGIDLGLNVTF